MEKANEHSILKRMCVIYEMNLGKNYDN